MIFTVRKRPISGVSKPNRSRQANKGAIYVPSELINTRVKVMPMKEYWELKRKAELFETIQKFTEEPWVVR
jgi:hypothetical protein